MGCPNSKLGREDDTVQICKDRKGFIKQAVEHRTSFASAHTAYIQSLRNVSNALREFIQGHEFVESELEVSYLMASGTIPVQVQETSPDESYKVVESYEADSFLELNMNPLNSPPSPQDSELDFFWSPLTSFDYDNQSGMDIELRRVREEEGIPDLEEDDGHHHHNMKASEDSNGGEMNQEDEVEYVNEENERDMNYIEVTKHDAKGEEIHDYTVYLNQRPTSIGEVIKDLEDQFTTICTSANVVSGVLEASKVQYTNSSSFLISSEGSSVFSQESCMLSGSHQATLDRLYVWEKKLYDQVKSGESVRIAYEKKRSALRNHDVKGVIITELYTQLKVSIQSIESISARIEILRDQELFPQILELFQGLARMWKVMAECHQIQKRTLDEAKLLLSSTLPCNNHHKKINTGSALNLVAQLLNWRACFQEWIRSQRSYVLSLTGWLLTCIRCNPDPEKVTLSTYPHLIFELCIGWSRLLKGLNEKHVVDKLDFFASCMGSLFPLKRKEEPYSGA